MPVGQELNVQDKSAFIPTERQCLAAMAMVCERGPIGESRQVSSWPEYQRLYGGFLAGRVEQHAAKRALDAGCWLLVSRVVHLTDPTDLTSRTSDAASVTALDRGAAPSHGRSTGTATFPLRLAAGQTLVMAIDGGLSVTVTFNGYARRLVGDGSYAAVTAGHALVLVVNGVTRTVAFAGTENTAALYAAAIAAVIPGVVVDVSGDVRITTDRQGTSASLVVDPTTDADVLAALGFSSGQIGGTLGSSNVADIEAVTAAEFAAAVLDNVEGCTAGVNGAGHPYIESVGTGTGSTVQITGGTARTTFGFDTTNHAGVALLATNTLTFTASSDGTWANGLRLVVSDDPGDPATRFRLRVQTAAGVVLETHDSLSMTSTDPRYVVNVLRDESLYFTATDLASAATPPANRPAVGTLTPTGGLDGLSGLVQADWIGDATQKTGLHAFDTERGFRLVSMPAVTDFDTQVAHSAYCAARKDCRPIHNVPSGVTSSGNAIAYRRRTAPYATGTAIDSAYGALYAGWHEVIDPVSKAPLWIPADGEVLAAHALACKESGPWIAPCGPTRGKLSTDVRRLRFYPSDTEVKAMTDAGVNCAYRDPDFGMVLEGAWTLQREESALRELNVCMGIDAHGEAISTGVRSLRYEPNDPVLWRALSNRADGYLRAVKSKRGALTSYRVVCNASVNTDAEIAARRTHLDVYIKPTPTSVEQKIGIIVTAQDVTLE